MAADSPFSAPVPDASPPSGANVTMIVVLVLGTLFVIGLICAGLLTLLLAPTISVVRDARDAARDAARQAQISLQMKQLGLGIHNYHSVHGQLPTAFTTDSSGSPLSSWRVSMLPFIEEQGRAEQWNPQEPWDSPANAALHSPSPTLYLSPMETDLNSVETHVFAVRDPNGSMSGTKVRFRDLTDGLANTILAVYLPGQTIHWAAPEDITLAELQAEIDKASPQNAVFVLMGDGAVERISDPLDAALVQALVTRNGGELVDF